MTRTLTPRQKQVRRLAERGLTNKQIAHKLDITVKTVKNHVYDANQKTDTLTRPRPGTVIRELARRQRESWWDAYHWGRP